LAAVRSIVLIDVAIMALELYCIVKKLGAIFALFVPVTLRHDSHFADHYHLIGVKNAL
jgi:hypothetical protein